MEDVFSCVFVFSSQQLHGDVELNPGPKLSECWAHLGVHIADCIPVVTILTSSISAPETVEDVTKRVLKSCMSVLQQQLLSLLCNLSLSMSTRPIPSRLVQLIQSGSYVEMRDLLTDNVQVRHHFKELRSAIGVQLLPVTSRPRGSHHTSILDCMLSNFS